MRDFLDLAAARASSELKGTVSSRRVISDLVLDITTTSGMEEVVLTSAGIVAGGESLARFPGRSAKISVQYLWYSHQFLRQFGIGDTSERSHASR